VFWCIYMMSVKVRPRAVDARERAI
jgi:hypothetical protein